MRCNNKECNKRATILFGYAGSSYCLDCKRKKEKEFRGDSSMFNIELTKEELDSLITQVSARLDELNKIQKEEALKGDVERVLEIDRFMQPIKSGYQKMMDERFSMSGGVGNKKKIPMRPKTSDLREGY